MNFENFDAVVENRIKSIKSVLTSKSKEYASDKDRLHNFKVAARIKNESNEKALWGMAVKHLVSVIDMIDEVEENKFNRSIEYVEEKIGDLQNYLILLEALLKERK